MTVSVGRVVVIVGNIVGFQGFLQCLMTEECNVKQMERYQYYTFIRTVSIVVQKYGKFFYFQKIIRFISKVGRFSFPKLAFRRKRDALTTVQKEE